MIPVGVLGSARTVTTWTPASIAGLALWLDGSDSATVALTSGKVTQWDDKSGQGRHVTQATDSKRPTYTATKNGLNVLTFGPTQKLQHNPSTKISASMTSFAVFKNTNPDSTYKGAPVVLGYQNLGRPLDGWAWARFLDGTLVSTTGTDLEQSVPWCVLTWTTSTASTGSMTEHRDGVLITSATGTMPQNDNQIITIASRADEGNQLTGDVAEVVIYGSALSTTDRQTVESYLKTKWGTP